MTSLSERHLTYARSTHDLLTGCMIEAVAYHGLEPPPQEAPFDLSQLGYGTKYPAIHSLDHGLVLTTDRGRFWITWDSTFYSYGLIVESIPDNWQPPGYSIIIDASHLPMWKPIIGSRVHAASIVWDEVIVSGLGTHTPTKRIYPQWLVIGSDTTRIFLGASEIIRDDETATGFMDNVLVTTDRDSAIAILHVPAEAV